MGLAQLTRGTPLRLLAFAAVLVCLGCFLGFLVDGSPGWELSAMDWVADRRGTGLTTVAKALSTLGSLAVLAPVAAVTMLWLADRGRRDDAISFAVVTLGIVAIDIVVKAIVDRPRPPAHHLVSVLSASFPSGHAAQAAGMLPALALLVSTGHARRLALLAAIALAFAIGLSRIYLGVHYPTDVLGGWALGAAWLLTVRRSLPQDGLQS